MKILLLHRQDSAVGYYRTRVRARMLESLGHEVTYSEEDIFYRFLKPKDKKTERGGWPEQWMKEHLHIYDLLIVDRALSNAEWSLFAGFRHYSRGMRMIVDFDDDFLQVPKWNPSYGKYQPGQESYEAGLNHLKVSEMVTVSTEPLKEACKDKAHRIHTIPNLIDPKDWEGLKVDPEREKDPHLRVLYGGASGHYGDMDEARVALEAMIEKQPVPWRLICFGSVPVWIHELAREYPGKVVKLPWIPFEDYPQAVAWGGFDVAIAPLATHPFNEAKSNIKWLEAGIQKIPFLCSKVGPYAQIPDGCAVRVENTPAQWADALRCLLKDKSFRESLKEEAYQAVKDEWTVDAGGEKLQIIVEEAASLPRILTQEDTRLPSDQSADQLAVPQAGSEEASTDPDSRGPSHVEDHPNPSTG